MFIWYMNIWYLYAYDICFLELQMGLIALPATPHTKWFILYQLRICRLDVICPVLECCIYLELPNKYHCICIIIPFVLSNLLLLEDSTVRSDLRICRAEVLCTCWSNYWGKIWVTFAAVLNPSLQFQLSNLWNRSFLIFCDPTLTQTWVGTKKVAFRILQ